MWIKTWGIIYDTIRESILKFTVIAFFGLSTLMLLFFIFFLNIDIVEGSIAAIKIFGALVTEKDPKEILKAIEIGFSVAFYYIILLFAIFSTSSIIPRMLDKGRIDLYLSKPIHRIHLLVGKAIGNFILVFFNTFYLLLGIWLILSWKLDIYDIKFLYTGVIIIYVYFVIYALNIFLGIVTKNSLIAIMVCYFIIFFESILHGIVSVPQFSNNAVSGIYWALPKTTAIAGSVVDLIKDNSIKDFTYYWTSGIFALFFYGISIWIFLRKDY